MNLHQSLQSLRAVATRPFASATRQSATRLAIALLLASATVAQAQTKPAAEPSPDPAVSALRADFITPPDAAKPMVRWWWFGPAVVKPEIVRELQQMKTDGIQGAEIAFVYPNVLDDPSKDLKNLTFLSPEMLDAVAYAQSEGRNLGLRIDVTLCSGWPYGGPATSLAEAATRLRIIEVPVAAGATSVAVPTLAEGKTFEEISKLKFQIKGVAKLAVGDTILSAAIANTIPRPKSASEAPTAATTAAPAGAPAAADSAEPEPPAPPADAASPSPAPGAPPAPRGHNAGPKPSSWDLATAQPLAINGSTITVAPSDKPRVALFFVSSHTGQQVKRAAVGAEGYVLDPFSHDAVATHLRAVGEPLVKAFGSTPPYAIFSDSLEAYGADWTPNLPAEFQKRRGYNLIPHLPELTAGGTPAAETVRHDYGRTLTELVDENYLTQINDWALAHHTKFRSQTYGEPAVSFSSQNLVGLAEGEHPTWRTFSTLRWATSANHVFNHNVSSGESFTWLHSPVFRATPLDMKAEVDLDFLSGENLIIFHGWPYSPPEGTVPEPGWSLYAAAVFNDHNPWHPVMPTVTDYIARVSQLLRQGEPANQVAVLLPTDDAWAGFTPAHVTVTGAMDHLITPALMSSILSAGYNVDFIDADAINSVGLGSHQILVIPPTNRIPLETLRKIAAFTKSGGKAIAVGHAPSIDPEGKSLPELTKLSNQLFSSSKSTLVANEAALPAALTKAARPDCQIAATDDATRAQLGFIRRKLASADVYFVTNTGNTPVETTATFATKHRFAETWNPDSTEAAPAVAAAQPLKLEPYESRVFVLSDTPTVVQPSVQPAAKPAAVAAKQADKAAAKPAPQHVDRGTIIDITSGWKVRFVTIDKVFTYLTNPDWTASPDTLHYSGEVVYSRDIRTVANPDTPIYFEINGGKPLPTPHPGLGMYANFEPPLREAAILVINDQTVGALWHPPYRLDITKYLKLGMNHIEIRVFNTALNAWSALPPRDYKPLIAKYKDRFQMMDLDKVAPIPSGIFGTVHLVVEPKPSSNSESK